MLCFLFVPAFDYKIYCLMLYHLLKSTLHLKANACSIGTFIRFYMQSSLHSKANACNIGTFIRFYIQMRVQIKNKAFAYRFYRPFTQQCLLYQLEVTDENTLIWKGPRDLILSVFCLFFRRSYGMKISFRY